MTELRPCASLKALDLQFFRPLGPERVQCERDLEEAGLPLPHCFAWAATRPSAESWFLAARDAQGRCRGGFAVEVNRSRTLPGHQLWRVERFGSNWPANLSDAAVAALAELASRDQRVLRVNVELFAPNQDRRTALCAALHRHGFHRVAVPRRYEDTLSIDLTLDETKLFNSFHAMARRNIRKIGKKAVEVRAIEDLALAGRIEELVRTTMGRTGGAFPSHHWPALLELSRRQPARSRLVGLFRTDRSGPQSLLAMAWGQHHGEYAHYDVGASVRDVDFNVPLAYALIWDLLCWAKRHGARWFDLGGITTGSWQDGADRLGGISDFKRRFSTNVVKVGGEWVLEPHRVRAWLASVMRVGAALLPRFGA